MIYRIAEKNDLDNLVLFLESDKIDNSFVKPLSQRNITIKQRVKQKYEQGKWILTINQPYEIMACCAIIPHENNVEVSTFVVSPNFQKMGIGSELFNIIKKICKEQYQNKPILVDSWEDSPIKYLCKKNNFEILRTYEDINKRPNGIKTIEYILNNY